MMMGRKMPQCHAKDKGNRQLKSVQTHTTPIHFIKIFSKIAQAKKSIYTPHTCIVCNANNTIIEDNTTSEIISKKHGSHILTMKTSTKMYLSIVLSTICIMFYQYQLSKASIMSLQGGSSGGNGGTNGNGNSNSIERNEVEGPLIKPNTKLNIVSSDQKIAIKPLKTTYTINAMSMTTDKRIVLIKNNNRNRNDTIGLNSATKSTTTIPPTTTNTSTSIPITTNLNAAASTTIATNGKTPLVAVSPIPSLYIITATYRRPEQIAEITRLGYTLKHVPNLFWLVIEDASSHTRLLTKQLKRIGVPFEHLIAPMPNIYKKRAAKPRGVSNRNRGLAWIRKNATEGVFYFADDDNTYDLEIFNQMRYTKKVSMWPVGLVTSFGLSSPIVRNGKLSGFYDGWIGGRKYPIDMAGFAVNVQFLLSRPKALMPYAVGYEEDKFLRSLAPLPDSDIELLASNCTEILTWHTQTKKNRVAVPLDMQKYNGTNLVNLRKMIV